MEFFLAYLVPILTSTVYMATPLIFASIGGAFSVRGGVMALGLESMMMCGAFCAVLGSYYTSSWVFGLLCGILGGMLIALFHAILSVRYRMNQVISGIGLNLLATAATTLLMQVIWKNKGTSELVASIDKTIGGPIPIISGQSFNFFVMVAVAVISWIVLFRTRYGLRLRMVGEQPKAASAVGLKVHRAEILRRADLRRVGRLRRRFPVPGPAEHVCPGHDRRAWVYCRGHRHSGPVQSRPHRSLCPAVRLLRCSANLSAGPGRFCPAHSDAALSDDPHRTGCGREAYSASCRCGQA